MRAKRIFTYCFCAALLICAMVNATQGAMLSSLIEHYSLESAAQGAAGSAQSLGQAFSLFFLFWLAGRVKKPTTIKISFVGIVVILFVVSFAPPFALLCVIFCLLGIATGTMNATTSALIPDLYEGKNISKYMSRLHGFFGLGGLIAPIFYMALANGGFKWNIVLGIAAAVFAAVLVLYLVISQHSLKQIKLPEAGNQKITLSGIIEFATSKRGLLLILSMFFYSSHQSAIVVWLIRYVTVFLDGATLGALSLSLFWLGITVSRLFMHRVPVSPIKIVLIGNCLSAAAILAGVLSGSAFIMTCCAPLIGLFNGVTIPVLLAAGCAERSGNTILPTNILSMALFSGQTISPLAVGALVARGGLNMGMLLSIFCAVICAALTYVYDRKPA